MGKNGWFLGEMIRLLLILFLWFGSLSHALERQLYVGRAEANITPKEPVALEGSFTLRISDGAHSPIRASVLIIGSGDLIKIRNSQL